MHKILFYTDTPMLGGTEQHMLTLARFLPREKYEVTLACSSYPSLDSWAQKFLDAGLGLIRLPVLHKHDPRHFFHLKKISHHFDLIHVHLWNPGSCRYAFFATHGKPIVATEHDPFSLSGLKGILKTQTLERTRAIIVATEASKKRLMEQKVKKMPPISIIKNGIDCAGWQTLAKKESREEVRTKIFNVDQNTPVLLCVAELNERKGQDVLIEAFKNVIKKAPKAKLIFVGDGPARERFQEQAAHFKSAVQFLGRQENVATLMAASDLFVLPSRREAFGLVLVEAGIVEVPIIASNVGGIQEVIEHNKTGILVEPENPEELAEKIIDLLSHPEHAHALGSAAQKHMSAIFSAERMAQETVRVYDGILTSNL